MATRDEAVRRIREAGEADGMVARELDRLSAARVEPSPKLRPASLTMTGLTLLAIFLAIEMLIVVPVTVRFYAWVEAPIPPAALAAIRLAEGARGAWPAVIVSYAFLAWMLLRRPTRAAGVTLIVLSGLLLLAMAATLVLPFGQVPAPAR
jgi:hypothetical protein